MKQIHSDTHASSSHNFLQSTKLTKLILKPPTSNTTAAAILYIRPFLTSITMLSARNRIVRERSGVQRGYDRVQQILQSKSSKHAEDDAPIMTRVDRALVATSNLYCTSSRLLDMVSVLEDAASKLTGEDVSMNQRKQMARNIKNLIIPLSKSAAELVRTAAVDVAPLPGCGEEHRKNEVDRKKAAKEAVGSGRKKANNVTVEMELISNFLEGAKKNARTSSSLDGDSTPPPKKRKTKNQAIETFITMCTSSGGC